jgi:hypothetical protein
MRHFLGVSGWRLCLIVFGLLLLGIASIEFVRNKPIGPVVPVVSVCTPLKPGMRRIGNPSGIQFDITTSHLSVHEGVEDAPPSAHGFYLQPSSGKSGLNISFGPLNFGEGTVSDPDAIFLEHLEKRTIVDETGHPVGEDYWGYLKSGERWRRVWLFKGGILAKYGFVDKNDAETLDRVIESACLLPWVPPQRSMPALMPGSSNEFKPPSP